MGTRVPMETSSHSKDVLPLQIIPQSFNSVILVRAFDVGHFSVKACHLVRRQRCEVTVKDMKKYTNIPRVVLIGLVLVLSPRVANGNQCCLPTQMPWLS